MATISITRDELLAKLKEAKAKADHEDAIATKAHEKEERAALAAFREKLREALKWDYATAKAKGGRYDSEVRMASPSCPVRMARPIEVAIRQVEMDSRKGRFNLHDKHDWYLAAAWLPESERPKSSVCD